LIRHNETSACDTEESLKCIVNSLRETKKLMWYLHWVGTSCPVNLGTPPMPR